MIMAGGILQLKDRARYHPYSSIAEMVRVKVVTLLFDRPITGLAVLSWCLAED